MGVAQLEKPHKYLTSQDFDQPAQVVAIDLLGKPMFHGDRMGVIRKVEAYCGRKDARHNRCLAEQPGMIGQDANGIYISTDGTHCCKYAGVRILGLWIPERDGKRVVIDGPVKVSNYLGDLERCITSAEQSDIRIGDEPYLASHAIQTSKSKSPHGIGVWYIR